MQTAKDGSAIVILEPYEIETAAIVGVRRQIEAIRSKLPDRHGAKAGDGFKNHIAGAIGEMAVAKYLNLFWPASVNVFRSKPDVGRWEVRTREADHYDLIVRQDDRDDSVFILVVGVAPKLRIVGWIRGEEAKSVPASSYESGREVAFFVPQANLHSVSTLPLRTRAKE